MQVNGILRAHTSNVILPGSKMNQLISTVNQLNLNKQYVANALIPFNYENEIIGYVLPSFYEELKKFSDIFQFLETPSGKPTIKLHENIEKTSTENKSKLLATVSSSLNAQGLIKGWRNELLPVATSFSSPPKFLMERSAMPYYGFKSYGVHINGFVREDSYITHLWVAKRSRTKSTWPGMLDHVVAGGQPHGIGLYENVMKECEEEASIPPTISIHAKAVGAISYNSLDENRNLKRDSLFCFDLELPKDFFPKPLDGEVESFELKEMRWVLEKVIEADPVMGYKPNCNLVLIDFFIRNGIISPESPRYLELLASLRTTTII
eukprot:gene7726-10499_t